MPTWSVQSLSLYDSSSIRAFADLEMSNAQHEHVLAIQRLAPRLAALRIELCPAHMSDSYFWKVYFVLLHSRLHKHDAELLSTPQVSWSHVVSPCYYGDGWKILTLLLSWFRHWYNLFLSIPLLPKFVPNFIQFKVHAMTSVPEFVPFSMQQSWLFRVTLKVKLSM